MLNNLRAEFVRKNLSPEKEIEKTLGCTYKTASNKTSGETDFTLPEALKIYDKYFANDGHTFHYLFQNDPDDTMVPA